MAETRKARRSEGAAGVVEAALAELQRQANEGQLKYVGPMDVFGRVEIAGDVDVAKLAHAIEVAMLDFQQRVNLYGR